MKKNLKKHIPQANKPLDKDELIQKYLGEKELENLLNKGYDEEIIFAVAKQNKENSRAIRIMDLIADILTWIIPIK